MPVPNALLLVVELAAAFSAILATAFARAASVFGPGTTLPVAGSTSASTGEGFTDPDFGDGCAPAAGDGLNTYPRPSTFLKPKISSAVLTFLAAVLLPVFMISQILLLILFLSSVGLYFVGSFMLETASSNICCISVISLNLRVSNTDGFSSTDTGGRSGAALARESVPKCLVYRLLRKSNSCLLVELKARALASATDMPFSPTGCGSSMSAVNSTDRMPALPC